MSTNDLIPATDFSTWMEALKLCGDYDIYHLPQHHLLAEEMGEGKSYLFFFRRKERYAALPFILRPVSTVKGLENSCYYDISSVYGYPGIVTSVKEGESDSSEFRLVFQSRIREIFKKLFVVAFFSRTNPLLPNTWMFKGMAELFPLSSTVTIALFWSDEKQLAGMTKGHKYDIRKARRIGVTVEEDKSFRYIDEFINIYNETMKRNRAHESYYFPKSYYLRLKKIFGESVRLYFARLDGEAISASMFFMSDRIIQYFLSGTPSEYISLNGNKLILDEVRQLGTKNGFSWLHLGGGVGSSEDNLYRFKAGFSKIRQPFEIAKMIVEKKIFSELCENRKKWVMGTGHNFTETNYFPAYREP